MNILNQLTIKHMMMNKKRTIVTIIGVILSTALMVGIGLLFSSVRDNSVKMIIRDEGSHHVVITGMDTNKLDILRKNVKVKQIDYAKIVGYASIEQDVYKPFIEVSAMNQTLLKTFPLVEGRYPQNENEILIPNGILQLDNTYKIGDTIQLSLGTLIENENIDTEGYHLKDMYHIENSTTKSYKIVGITDRNYVKSTYNNISFPFITLDQNSQAELLNAYITYKKPKDTYHVTETLLKNLNMEEVEPQYNSSLLSLSGVSRYNNMLSSMMKVILIVLSLVSIGCIIVIYNSFAISVMERKKQFGLFSSIGTTKLQLRKTVFFEAIFVGTIGIPLGILGAFVGIGTVIAIINHLLPNTFSVPLALSVYPLFIWVPILFMVIVILISAFLPARKASKITPIEAIRQNDDIKINTKKIKTRKWVRKFFGIEGELALKNMKRNKRKYRITIVSLFISIVLFISFSGIVYYGISTSIDYTGLPSYDILATFGGKLDHTSTIQKLMTHEQVDEMVVIEVSDYITYGLKNDHYEKSFLDLIQLDRSEKDYVELKVLGLDQKTYDKWKTKIGLKEDKPIVINYTKGTYYTQNSRKTISMKKYKNLPNSLPLCIYNNHYDETNGEQELLCNKNMEDFYYTEEYPMGLDLYVEGAYIDQVVIVVPESMYPEYDDVVFREQMNISNSINKNVFIKASKYDKLNQLLDELKEDEKSGLYSYVNVKEELKLMRNLVFVIKMLLYGFITLVTLIGVTSVFNTINTSINLRRKEFAMLRSMGLTPKGFNKILHFESIFFGLKSLFYGIPVSIAVVYLLYNAFNGIAEQKFIIPYDSIGIAVLGVFLIVFITMWYASRKLKKENILDAIREENI